MRRLIGTLVFPYSQQLQHYRWDAVVVGGGELGGVSLEIALRNCLSPSQEAQFHTLRSQRRACEFLASTEETEVAYIPAVHDYTQNRETPIYFNSMGLGRLAELPSDLGIVSETMRRLQEARGITVREKISQSYAAAVGLDSLLTPDSVHCVKHFLDDEVSAVTEPPDDGYLVFQINEELLTGYGVETVAESLLKLSKSLKLNVKLMAAGVANYHDSFDQYRSIVDYFAYNGSAERVSIIYERAPLQLVALIKHASLWLGSSLHGRVVAIAYGVPRVSLPNKKVRNYATLWDPEFPIDTLWEDWEDACRLACAVPLSQRLELAAALQSQSLSAARSLLQELDT